MLRNTVAHIDLSALRHNLEIVRAMAPNSGVVSVIKADAYGHGVSAAVRALAGTDIFAVSTPEEAVAVRESGWRGRLLSLEGFFDPEGFALARELQLELVVHQREQLEFLRHHGGLENRKLWLKIDTGMNRLGFRAADAEAAMAALEAIPGAGSPVLMTHFACADNAVHPLNKAQIECFQPLRQAWRGEVSMCNSAALINFPDTHSDWIRPGILLYGISPIPGQTGHALGLRPVMQLVTELISIKLCKKGETIGYGASFSCPRDMTIGVAAIGYGDGYPRQLGNGAPVLVNGHAAELVGRVSMDMITIDLTGHPSASVGDSVCLWGGTLPVETVAEQAGAIPYELICGLTRRIRRVIS